MSWALRLPLRNIFDHGFNRSASFCFLWGFAELICAEQAESWSSHLLWLLRSLNCGFRFGFSFVRWFEDALVLSPSSSKKRYQTDWPFHLPLDASSSAKVGDLTYCSEGVLHRGYSLLFEDSSISRRWQVGWWTLFTWLSLATYWQQPLVR